MLQSQKSQIIRKGIMDFTYAVGITSLIENYYNIKKHNTYKDPAKRWMYEKQKKKTFISH